MTEDLLSTIEELYRFRMVYHALIVREWTQQGLYDVHKSYYHHDGERCFGDENWFIVVAMLPEGQVSNHYHKEFWDLFECPEVPIAKYAWDGHTSTDVCDRLENLVKRLTHQNAE
jgi:hypothetical protein